MGCSVCKSWPSAWTTGSETLSCGGGATACGGSGAAGVSCGAVATACGGGLARLRLRMGSTISSIDIAVSKNRLLARISCGSSSPNSALIFITFLAKAL